MGIPTLLRQAEHRALRALTLSGTVLDLGGDARAEYRSLIQGSPVYTTVNLDAKTRPDVLHNLEQPLPFEDASYDHALLINVLEHVYEHHQLLREAARVTKSGGTVVVVVPYLFPLHPSPSDYWRFSDATLRKECEVVGLQVEKVSALGSGVFAAQYLLIDRLLPWPLRALGFLVIRPLVFLFDFLFAHLARLLGKKYTPTDYALGYALVARKH